MWRAEKDNRSDAKIAKSLRTVFVRKYCQATFVIIPSALSGELSDLEKAVQALAPVGMLDWGNKRSFVSLPEPRELVDALLDDLRYSPESRAAVARQAALYQPA